MTKPNPKTQATLFAEPEANPTLTAPARKPKTGRAAPPEPKAEPAKAKPAPKPTAKAKPKSTAKPGTAVATNVVPLQQTPANMLAVIAKAASDPNVIPDKMRALLEMQKEIVAEEARIEFNRAFLALTEKMPYINPDGKIEIREKDGTGQRLGRVQQSTPYATFRNIYRVVKPLLMEHGFTLSFATEPSADGQRIIVKTFLDHVRGHQRSTAFPLPAETSGSKNNVQGWGSSFSYGKRYGMTALLNIISDAKEDQDRDGFGDNAKVVDARPTIDSDQLETLTDQVQASVGVKRFCEKYEIDAIKDLPAEMFDEAVLACQAFATQKKQRGNG